MCEFQICEEPFHMFQGVSEKRGEGGGGRGRRGGGEGMRFRLSVPVKEKIGGEGEFGGGVTIRARSFVARLELCLDGLQAR